MKIEIAPLRYIWGHFGCFKKARMLCVSRGGGITLSQRSIGIIELDERLASDPNGVELKKLVERLVAGKQRVVRTMDHMFNSAIEASKAAKNASNKLQG